MPSTNKTDLGFNQWIGTDKPKRDDFNADNALTDQLINEAFKNIDDNAKSVSEALASKAEIGPMTSWTPTLSSDGGAGVVSYAQQTGWYNTQGNLCYIYVLINVSSWSGLSGGIYVSGLPVAPLIGAPIAMARSGIVSVPTEGEINTGKNVIIYNATTKVRLVATDLKASGILYFSAVAVIG